MTDLGRTAVRSTVGIRGFTVLLASGQSQPSGSLHPTPTFPHAHLPRIHLGSENGQAHRQIRQKDGGSNRLNLHLALFSQRITPFRPHRIITRQSHTPLLLPGRDFDESFSDEAGELTADFSDHSDFEQEVAEDAEIEKMPFSAPSVRSCSRFPCRHLPVIHQVLRLRSNATPDDRRCRSCSCR